MKNFTLLLTALLLSASYSFAQLKVTKINSKGQDHYIANAIGYPIAGIYMPKNEIQPITLLTEDGTGYIQNEDLENENIVWGIECSESGIPLFKEGFSSAVYTFWFDKTAANTEEDMEWQSVQFSIHYERKQMFINGERVKQYID